MNGWVPRNLALDELMRRWVREQVASLQELRSRIVTAWSGDEMAVRVEGPTGGPQFHDPGIPFLQVGSLYLSFADGGTRVILSHQNYAAHGGCLCSLCIDVQYGGLPDENYEEGSIYRTRLLPELPVGEVESVVVVEDRGNVTEVCLTIAGSRITLWSGEVYEEWDGSLRVERPDESVLIQVTKQEN